MTKLDTSEARPLTSREISKVICAMLGSVANVHPEQRVYFEVVLESLLAMLQGVDPRHTAMTAIADRGKGPGEWVAAFSGVIGGFAGWCDGDDVLTALRWVRSNLATMFPPVPQRAQA